MKRILALLLALSMIFALCACGSKELSAEEKEKIYQEITAEKAAATEEEERAEETAAEKNNGYQISDFYGVWKTSASDNTIEIGEDFSRGNSFIFRNGRGSSSTLYGMAIDGNSIVNYSPLASAEWIASVKASSAYIELFIEEVDGELQLRYQNNVYVRDADTSAENGVSSVLNGLPEEKTPEISFENPVSLYDDERVSVSLIRIFEEPVYGREPNKCIEFKIKNKLDSPIRLWKMIMYLEGEEMHHIHKQNISEIYGGKSAIRGFIVEYGDRTPLNSLDELHVGECMLDIEIRSEDGSTIVDEFMISFDYDVSKLQ